jgi:hypothetical protein
MFRTIVYAAILSFLICLIAFLFAKGGSTLEYLSTPVVKGFVVCVILLPYWYKKIKQDSRINLRFIINVAIAAGTAIIISWASLVLFYFVSTAVHGPPL